MAAFTFYPFPRRPTMQFLTLLFACFFMKSWWSHWSEGWLPSNRFAMADAILMRSLSAKKLNLSSKRLDKVPRIIGSLSEVVDVELKNNRLSDLPEEFGHLVQVSRHHQWRMNILNVGPKRILDDVNSHWTLRKKRAAQVTVTILLWPRHLIRWFLPWFLSPKWL